MPRDPSLVEYYARRAQEYERIYQKPERQADLAALKTLCAETLAGQAVLEIACGTGYWTQPISQTAPMVVATDINKEVLRIARGKKYGCKVSFQRVDAFNLKPLAEYSFTAAVAMHWWSHLRKSEIHKFLRGFHRALQPGALVVLMDNRYVPGSSTPISGTDPEGNTWQMRQLADGTQHEVLKNFPSESEMREVLARYAVDVHWTELPYYWFLTYRLAP